MKRTGEFDDQVRQKVELRLATTPARQFAGFFMACIS
jgi:hypothetical protein